MTVHLPAARYLALKEAEIRRQSGGQRRSYVPFMAAATCCYLIVELGFNARLLDVVGGRATPDEIDAIELWGRIISGVALTLVAWGSFILPRAHRLSWPHARTGIALITAAACCVTLTYQAEQLLIDTIVDRSSGTMRQNAARLRLLANGLLLGIVRVDGIDLRAEVLSRPEGKAYLALFPFLAMSTPDLTQKLQSSLASVVTDSVEWGLGGPEAMFNGAFRTSIDTIKASYARYQEAIQRYQDARATIPREQDEAWRKYVADLTRKGYEPGKVPLLARGRVIKSVHASGVPVPNGWHTGDQKGFNDAVELAISDKARKAFDDGTRATLGEPFPPNLSFADFVRHPSIQARWRRELQLPIDVPLNVMGFDDYQRVVYGPLVRHMVTQRSAELTAKSEAYSGNGAQAELGRRSVEALIVPPIALFFSLAGALTHLFKVSRYLTILRWPVLRFRTVGLIAGLIGIAAIPLVAKNDLTRSRAYSYLEAQTEADLGKPAALAARWIVQAQPYFYPVNEAVRRFALIGYGFGYAPDGR